LPPRKIPTSTIIDSPREASAIRLAQQAYFSGVTVREFTHRVADSTHLKESLMSHGIEALEKMVRGEIPEPPIARLIGFHLILIRPGEAVIEMEASEKHANPMGTLHGGILCDIADAAMGLAYASTLADGESFTTLELKINFLRPVWNDRLRATGRFVKGGKTVGLVECDVTASDGALVARATSTCMTLRGEQAQGRGINSVA
jgi:uncharacterized protein (TIGR00369 family)